MRVDALRRFALSLPEAEERETWGTATFRVDSRIFAMFSEQERHTWVKSTIDEQRALDAMFPDTFFVPPYVGSSGLVGVVISKVDPQEMRELVAEAWRMTAHKELVEAYDEGVA
jgi:hypothetical protein